MAAWAPAATDMLFQSVGVVRDSMCFALALPFSRRSTLSQITMAPMTTGRGEGREE